MLLVDTHCHLNFNWFDHDREAVIQRAREGGVQRVLIPGIDLASSRQSLKLADMHPMISVATGVHPNDASVWNQDSLNDLRALVVHPSVVAIGEIGLDYYHDRTPPGTQREVFRQQLGLAQEKNLPVVIHVRDRDTQGRPAMRDVLEQVADWAAELTSKGQSLAERPGVLHSFSGDLEAAWRAVELGFLIGVTGPVTFRSAGQLQALVKEMPLECLLVETDAPFLTPHPWRGQRNEPAYVRYIVEKIAQLKELPVEDVAQATTANAERLFLWQVMPTIL